MSDHPRLLFDRALHRQRLERAAARPLDGVFLKRRAVEDAVERLEGVSRSFPLALELGARSGLLAEALKTSPAGERVGALVEADYSQAMLRGRQGLRVVADEEQLPFAEERFNLVVSLLNLHWTNDLVGALIQIRRILKPDGLFIGALLGGETLHELRAALMQAEIDVVGGAGPRVSPFADPVDSAGLLQRAGFALPVADVDRVRVRYAHPLALMADLRAMGEGNVLLDRARRPLVRPVLARLIALYQERFGLPDGRIEATFEIIWITGWAPHESQQQPLKPGSASMRLADALGAVEGRLQPD